MAILDNETVEGFSVVDLNNALKPGIPFSEFDYLLYEPDGSSSSVVVTFSELGGGSYRAHFTPDSIGNWYLIVTHDMYFPWGKASSIHVVEKDIDTVAADVEIIKDLERLLIK